MKILVKNKNGEVIRVYKNIRQASLNEKASYNTIKRSLQGKKIYGDFTYEYGEHRDRKGNGVVLIEKNGNVKKFNKQKDLADYLHKSRGTISCYLSGKAKSTGFEVMTMEDYEKLNQEEQKSEITKPIKEEYYVNILVGLANGTLVDGATYKINNQEFIYSREKQALMINGYVGYSKETMLEMVRIELPLLTEEERIFLKNLLKAFSNVKGIRKCNTINNGMQFIRIETSTPVNNIDLPDFIEGKYYSNLEENRLYTIDELNI